MRFTTLTGKSCHNVAILMAVFALAAHDMNASAAAAVVGEQQNLIAVGHPITQSQNKCGPSNKLTCNPLQPGGGWCCSSHGFCGNGPLYCGEGCQEGYGKCHHSTPANRPPRITFCGPNSGGIKCAPDDCCSPEGFCGRGEPFCGLHCQQQYGKCDIPPTNKITPQALPSKDQSQKLQTLPAQTPATDQRCGPKHGHQKCTQDKCCSSEGFCGVGKDYCTVPQSCQRGFGRCDSDITPAGYDTSCDKRKMHTHLPFGKYINHCKKHKTIALTFDDGPSDNTPQLLDLLRSHDAHATFFLSGINNGKGQIDTNLKWIDTIRRMIVEGHQIGSHSWSHPDLDKLSSKGRQLEMLKNERAIANIIGKYPTFMRPPYIHCHGITGCLKAMKNLGYHVASYEVDSRDTDNVSYDTMVAAVDNGFKRAGHKHKNIFFIQHDTNPSSAFNLTSHILTKAKEHQWKVVTLAECLGAPEKELYRIPTWINVGTVAPNGCLMSGPGLCVGGAHFTSREGCFANAATCFIASDGCKPLGKDHTHICHGLEDFCQKEMLFCSECDKPGHPSCHDKEFWYKPRQHHGKYS